MKRKKIILVKLNKKSFGFFLSRCLAQTFLIFILPNDYVLSHTYTSDCMLYGESLSLDYHYTDAATFTTSWQSGAFSTNCSYFFFPLQSCHQITIIRCFILRITWLFVRRLSGPSFAQIFKTYFLKFPVYICKTERSFSYFTQSVIYVYKSYTEPLIGSQAT